MSWRVFWAYVAGTLTGVGGLVALAESRWVSAVIGIGGGIVWGFNAARWRDEERGRWKRKRS